jgi:hypothetical protein
MFSEIKTLSDLFIKLFSARAEGRSKLLAGSVTPMYETTMVIVTAYRDLIEKAKHAADTADPRMLALHIAQLAQLRASYLAQRQAVLALAETAQERWGDGDLASFATHLVHVFFGDPDAPLYLGGRTFGATALELLDDYKVGKVGLDEFKRGLWCCERMLDHHWEEVCSDYAALTIKKA